MLCLYLRHDSLREVEHLLAQQLEDLHVVLAERFAGLGRPNQVWYKRGPFGRPFVLQNLNQNHVQL
jgi:hypothetical protein